MAFFPSVINPISVFVKNGKNQKSRKTGMIEIRKE
jgi:hypothetical protein